jgi:hypothetical protein
VTGSSMASLAPETCLDQSSFATLIRDPIRQAIAETFIGAVCPKVSMAPVLAITGMVAGTAIVSPSTPLGRFLNRSSPGRIPSPVSQGG